MTALAVGIGTLAVILLLKGHKRIPGILVAVVGATMVVGWLDLGQTAGVKVLGPVPQGLPDFVLPLIGPNDIVPVLLGGFAVAIVSFADTSVLSRVYAARTGTRVDPNQEMVGLGAANLAAGFFQGFPISSSSSRTPVAEAAGARTQLTGVVGALVVALLLVAAPMLFRNLPTTALAAVVIAAAIGLFEFADLRRIYRIQQWEFWLSIALYRRGRRVRGDSGHRPGDRHRRHRIPVGWLATAFGGARQGRRASRAITTSPDIPRRAGYPAWSCSAGTRPCSSPTSNCSAIAFGTRSRRRRPRCGGWW